MIAVRRLMAALAALFILSAAHGAQAGGPLVICVDGLTFSETFDVLTVSQEKSYLRHAVLNLGLNLPPERIIAFYWDGDATQTPQRVQELAKLLTERSGQGYEVILVGHSWGSVLSYLASYRAQEKGAWPVHLITLGSPLYSQHNENTACGWDGVVGAFTAYWLAQSGCPDPAGCVLQNTVWNNYWAWGDVFSGPLNPLGASGLEITDHAVDGKELFSGNCSERNLATTPDWHAYTTLIADYADYFGLVSEGRDNSGLRKEVRDLIEQAAAGHR